MDMCINSEVPSRCGIRERSAREAIALALVIWIAMQSADVRAGEDFSTSVAPPKPDFFVAPRGLPLPSTSFALSPAYQVDQSSTKDLYSPHDFRSRGHLMSEGDGQTAMAADAPTLRTSSVWQQLSDYRARGRIRLLTLWESGASTVSLQAGKKGEPSLQWTSRSMNRGGSTRGLLDPLLAASVAGASRGLRSPQHPATTDLAARAAKLADVGAAATR